MAALRLCSIPDCDKPLYGRGWCRAHYKRWTRHGDPLAGGPTKIRNPGPCLIDGCDKPAKRHGWCYAHFGRWKRHGDPEAVGKGTPDGMPQIYLHDFVLPYDGDDCLIWPYAKNTSGYGHLYLDGHQVTVSRYACIAVNGEPPTPNHHAAHSCGMGKHGCVNPRHLSWKTPSENCMDKALHGTNRNGGRRPKG